MWSNWLLIQKSDPNPKHRNEIDLNGFNNKELIETVYKRNYVLLSAIGHMVDTTLLDYGVLSYNTIIDYIHAVLISTYVDDDGNFNEGAKLAFALVLVLLLLKATLK